MVKNFIKYGVELSALYEIRSPAFVFVAGVLTLLAADVAAHGEEETRSTEPWEVVLLLLHVVTAVLMAWPLYALITVNARKQMGPPLSDRLDAYMENVIRPNTKRCIIYQLTALVTGILLVVYPLPGGVSALSSNWVVGGKNAFAFSPPNSSVQHSLPPPACN